MYMGFFVPMTHSPSVTEVRSFHLLSPCLFAKSILCIDLIFKSKSCSDTDLVYEFIYIVLVFVIHDISMLTNRITNQYVKPKYNNNKNNNNNTFGLKPSPTGGSTGSGQANSYNVQIWAKPHRVDSPRRQTA